MKSSRVVLSQAQYQNPGKAATSTLYQKIENGKQS
jgi:hypothetical protein